MQQKRTFCRICEPLCPLVATVDCDGTVVKLAPDKAHPVSQGFACHKGLNYLQVHHDPDRVNAPLRRRTSRHALPARFEPTTWDEALTDIGQRLRAIRDAHGPDAIGVYYGNPVSLNSNAYPLAASFGAQIGTRRTFNAGTQDTNNKPVAVEAVLGTSNLFPIPDYARTQYLLCFGGNPKVSHWTYSSIHRPMSVLQDIVQRGGKVRFINARKIESSTASTGEVTLIRPDTDVYLMAALLHELDRLGCFNTPRLAEQGANIQGLREFIAHYPPERVAPITGIDPATIRTIASEYAAAPRAAVYMATGVNQGRQGTLAYWLLLMLSFVSGNLGREGGDYYARGVYPNARAAGTAPPQTVHTDAGPLTAALGALPGYALADLILQKEQPIRALVVLSGNPLLSLPGEARLREALPQLELMVHVDLYRNATAEYADYVLPAADWLERAECNLPANGVQPKPYVQAVDAVVPPQHERRDDWWIISRLQQAMGLPSALDHDAATPLARARKILSKAGLSLEQLMAEPCQTVQLPQPDRAALLREYVFHPDGRVDCCPARFSAAMARCHRLFDELAAEPADTLKLISLRTHYMHNSYLANMPALKRGEHALNPLHMHPADATRHGLTDGDQVTLHNRFGAIDTPIQLDDSLMPGVVAMAHGYGHGQSFGLSRAHAAPGANVNALMPTGPGSHEPLSNMAHLTGVPVQIRRCAD